MQVGFGNLPYFILQHLEQKKDLGIHTQMITDAFIPLFEKGVITNKKKNFLPDRAVATICMGSKKIYDYIDKNPKFYFRSSDFVNDPVVVGRSDNFISIMESEENRAEVACLVREDFQGLGMASFLLGELEKIAIDNGYIGFSAYVLAENRAMLHVFHKHYLDAQKQLENGHVQLYMDFKNSKTGYDSADRDQIQTP